MYETIKGLVLFEFFQINRQGSYPGQQSPQRIPTGSLDQNPFQMSPRRATQPLLAQGPTGITRHTPNPHPPSYMGPELLTTFETKISPFTAGLISLLVAAVSAIPVDHLPVLNQISTWADHALGCLMRHQRSPVARPAWPFPGRKRPQALHGLREGRRDTWRRRQGITHTPSIFPALRRDTEPGEIPPGPVASRCCLPLTPPREEKSKAASLPRIKMQLGSN